MSDIAPSAFAHTHTFTPTPPSDSPSTTHHTHAHVSASTLIDHGSTDMLAPDAHTFSPPPPSSFSSSSVHPSIDPTLDSPSILQLAPHHLIEPLHTEKIDHNNHLNHSNVRVTRPRDDSVGVIDWNDSLHDRESKRQRTQEPQLEEERKELHQAVQDRNAIHVPSDMDENDEKESVRFSQDDDSTNPHKPLHSELVDLADAEDDMPALENAASTAPSTLAVSQSHTQSQSQSQSHTQPQSQFQTQPSMQLPDRPASVIDLTSESVSPIDRRLSSPANNPSYLSGISSSSISGSFLPPSQFNPTFSSSSSASSTLARPLPAARAPKPPGTPSIKITQPPRQEVDLRDNSDDDEMSDNKFGTVLCAVMGVAYVPGRAAVGEKVKLVRFKPNEVSSETAIRVDNRLNQVCGLLGKDVGSALAPLLDENLIRVEAKVGSVRKDPPNSNNVTDIGLRVDLYGRTADCELVESTLRKFPMITYLSLKDKPMPQAVPNILASFDPKGNDPRRQLGVYVNEKGEVIYYPLNQSPAGLYQQRGPSLKDVENDLDQLFGKEIDLATMPLADTPTCLRTSLHPYQRQGLAWMLKHEAKQLVNLDSNAFGLMGWSKQMRPNGTVTYTNALINETSAEPPEMARGGILADEMGLGKTLQVLSLIGSTLKQSRGMESTSPTADPAAAAASSSSSINRLTPPLKTRRMTPTLIVCPLSVITNWEQQILHHFHPSQCLTYYIYHGGNRIKDVSVLRQYDVLITTYNILAQEYDLSCEALGIDVEGSDSEGDDPAAARGRKKEKKKRVNKQKMDAAVASALAERSSPFLSSVDNDDNYAFMNPSLEDSKVKFPLFEIEFFRVILDEAHVIRERNTLQSRAARGLRAERRWAISGTPLINKVDDAFALLNFLKVFPFSHYAMWQKLVLQPLKNNDKKGMERLQNIMTSTCLRRRKNEEINGRRILQLPEKIIRTLEIVLEGKERILYDKLAQSGREKFQKLLQDKSVMRNYAMVLEILLRMRQSCNHSMLVPPNFQSNGFVDPNGSAMGEDSHKAELHRLASLLEEGIADECGICRKLVEDPVITGCAHFFCKACLDPYLENPAYYNSMQSPQLQGMSHPPAAASSSSSPPNRQQLFCPLCQAVLDKSLILSMRHKELLRFEAEQAQMSAAHQAGQVTLSSKLRALFTELQQVLNRGEKSVVFSQWTSFLDILQSTLRKANVSCVRLDGQMNATNRARALKSFEEDDSIKVFLISLKAGGVGLNLTSANNVFLTDLWWNTSIEDQAIDRVHRLGQTRQTNVVRFVCKDTIEEKIIQLQNTKRLMTTTALSRASKSREDMQAERLQDLRSLFA